MESLSNLFPTDNLYKWLAITGLSLFIFSVIYPGIRVEEFLKEGIRLEGKVKLLSYKLNSTEKKIDKLEKDMKENKEIKNFDSFVKQQQEDLEKSGVTSIELDTIVKLLHLETRELYIFVVLGFIGQIIGLFMTSVGFYFWYFRHQKFQDEIITLQIEEYRQNLRNRI